MDDSTNSTKAAIAAQRQLLENPYAFLNGEGSLEAIAVSARVSSHAKAVLKLKVNPQSASKVNSIAIEQTARDLHRDLWNNRDLLWPSGVRDPIALLEPELAAKMLGIDFDLAVDLGNFRSGDIQFVTAGQIDRGANRISISRSLPIPERRFTAAHEIGHWLLHSEAVMHRDRPIQGSEQELSLQDPMEQQANYFAACFLMPKNLVTQLLEQHFSTQDCYTFSNTSAQELDRTRYGHYMKQGGDPLLAKAKVLASAESFRGQWFRSLAATFGVSISAMAVRIKELRLVR